jgi:hypothetical protein
MSKKTITFLTLSGKDQNICSFPEPVDMCDPAEICHPKGAIKAHFKSRYCRILPEKMQKQRI